MVYRLEDGAIPINPLVDGEVYRVVKTDNNEIQLKRNDAVTTQVHFERFGSTVKIVRTDGLDWADFGFGQTTSETLIISGSGANNGTYTIASAFGDTLTLADGSTTVSSIDATHVKANVTFTAAADSDSGDAEIKRNDSRNWSADGFMNGMFITVGEATSNNGDYTISSVSGTTLILSDPEDVNSGTEVAFIQRAALTKGFDQPVIELDPIKADRTGDPPPDAPDAAKVLHSLIAVDDQPIKLSGGGELEDGRTYYIEKIDNDNFKLCASEFGSILSLSTSGLGGSMPHSFSPVEDITTATGVQTLRINIPVGAIVSGTHSILGPGGVPLSLTSPAAGDGISAATAKGSGGGLVGINNNRATINYNPTTKAYIDASLVTAGGDVSVVTSSDTNASAYAKNGTGGFVASGKSRANSNQTNTNEAYIGLNVQLIAGGDLTVKAESEQTSKVSTRSKAGGALGLADAESKTSMNYTTKATVSGNADLLVSGHVNIHADTRTTAKSHSYASGKGFGGDGESFNYISLGSGSALTQAEIKQGAILTANTLSASATVSRLRLLADGKAYGAGFYSKGEDDSDVSVNAHNNVLLGQNALVTGLEGVDFRARFSGVDTDANSFARSTGFLGWVSADANNTTILTNQVTGVSDTLVTAGPRDNADPNLLHPAESSHLAFYVDTDNGSVDVDRRARTSKRSLASGGSHGSKSTDQTRNINFSSDVLILSERTPVLDVQLIVDDRGQVTKAVNASVRDGSVTERTSGEINSLDIFVNDIVNLGAGDVVFRADDLIAGSGGFWEFRDSLSQVRITNTSNKDLILNNINVLGDRQPVVWLQPSTVSRTLTFDLEQDVAPSLVDIRNQGTGNVIINGTIENPIGTTSIVNTQGAILSSDERDAVHNDFSKDRVSLIRTNILRMETTGVTQDVGEQDTRVNVDVIDAPGIPAATDFETRRVSNDGDSIFLGFEKLFYTGQQVIYEAVMSTPLNGLTDGEYYYVIASDDGLNIQMATSESNANNGIAINIGQAGGQFDGHSLTPVIRFNVDVSDDAYLDVKARQRGLSNDYFVTIDAVVADDDIDILMQPSVRELDVGQKVGVLVKYPEYAGGKAYFNFFMPEVGDPEDLNFGAFATDPTEIESTYDYRAKDTDGEPTLPGVIAGGNIIIKAAEFDPSDTIINVLGITEILSSGDINVLTNGNITLTEKNGDMRVERIKSTGNDVLLYSPVRIIDARDDAGLSVEADVTGVNITMVAGTGLVNPPGEPDNPMPLDADLPLGGIGMPDNFLEINVDVLNGMPPGVLRALDITADSTAGIYLDEVSGDLQIHTVETTQCHSK